MVNNYTDFSFLKYLYQETDICEKLEVEHLLEENKEARSRFNAFEYLSSLLTKAELSPSALNVQKLKLYAQIDEVQAN